MKKYLNILLWLSGIVLFIFLTIYVSKRQKQLVCKKINIEFNDNSDKKQYVDNKYITDFIKADSIIGKLLSKASMSKLEHKLKNNPYIKNAEVYKNINGTLNIEITQRIPILRIINSYNIGYYIDKSGILMPISNKLNKRVLVANGNISYVPSFDSLININSKQFDGDNSVIVLRDILTLTNFINSDKFWRAQIQQIYITNKNEIELVPLVGNHIIELGNVDMYKKKLGKLKIMYKKGFSSCGWNKYKTVSLKYNKQVVCSKSW